MGIGSFLGDPTILGFMKAFPPDVISGYASGNGAAGIVGTLYCLLFRGILGFDYW